ncbi:glycoside hydrolase family 5 protein [Hyaloscypha hepaticicola]|uniref:Endoglucanase EG-II n=1 Tax=Hyaloscypha hepaticicola TaxID=2082293 RepID=A0A2J6QI88_9HELO|nr:glycoside hydrolase family 5 protein [Hyaloscypha hepaticicola]
MNIAGFEFGCQIDGTCPLDTIQPPIASLGFGDGAGQMEHFVKDDGMNIFRLPVSWQYLTNNVIGPLDKDNFANYDLLMQSCLKTGAYCMIDIHNFARWNGGIIGQGGPTDAQFADLWTQLATKYADNAFVMFELMNEPHDIDLTAWVASCQQAVAAIRKAEKVSHTILLPGENFSSAGTFLAGWGAALASVTNPDGSTTNLILDLHKYLDVDNSGDHPDCVMDNVADTFEPVAAWLRTNKRQAMVSETGAGVTSPSCFTDFCAQNTALNANSDVYLAFIPWTAGSVNSGYILDLAPTLTGTKWVDQPMAVSCVIDVWSSVTGSAAPTWGLTFNAKGIAAPTGAAATSTTGSAAASTSSSSVVSTSKSATVSTSGSEAIQTTLSTGSQPSATLSASKTKAPNSANGVKVAGGLMAGSLLLAAILL